MSEHKTKFKFEKETKNTYKFSETPPPGQAEIIGSLYVKKFVFASRTPSTVEVTVNIP